MADQRETTLPTEKEIAKLPRWAVVAFAARCARRVQPLFQSYWPDAPEEHVAALERVITLSERAAAARTAAYDAAYAAAARTAAYAAAYAAYRAADAADAAYAADRAAAAADAADAAYRAAAAADAATAATAAATAAFVAKAAVTAHANVAKIAIKAIRLDFERLRNAAEEREWGHKTPVPPEFFGPLWPDGEPEGWPLVRGSLAPLPAETPPPNLDRFAPLRVYVDPGEAPSELITELYLALSALYEAHGGSGLQIVKGETREFVGEEVTS